MTPSISLRWSVANSEPNHGPRNLVLLIDQTVLLFKTYLLSSYYVKATAWRIH